MFEVRFENANIMRNIVNAVKDFLEEATFCWSENGLELQASDASEQTLICLSMLPQCFEKYQCEHKFEMGVKTAALTEILERGDEDEYLTITAQEGATFITITYETLDNEVTAKYELDLVDCKQDHLDIPVLQYSCIMRMPSDQFEEICDDLVDIADKVTISCTEDGIQFIATDEIHTTTIEVTQCGNYFKEGEAVIIELGEPVILEVLSNHLKAYTNATPLSEQVQVSMLGGMPVVVDYAIGELGLLSFHLAPILYPQNRESSSDDEENCSEANEAALT